MLYEVDAADPWVFGGAAAGLVAAALLGMLIAALRAAAVDLLRAVRFE